MNAIHYAGAPLIYADRTQSSWWLLMPWHQMGTRPLTTTIMPRFRQCSLPWIMLRYTTTTYTRRSRHFLTATTLIDKLIIASLQQPLQKQQNIICLHDIDWRISCMCACINTFLRTHIEGILPKGPYPPCLSMADRALLAGYPRYITLIGRRGRVTVDCLRCRPHGT